MQSEHKSQIDALLTSFNSSPTGADDIFKCIFLNENDRISVQISLKFVPKCPINNESVLVQVMAWRRTGAKPLPESMMTQFTDVYISGDLSNTLWTL